MAYGQNHLFWDVTICFVPWVIPTKMTPFALPKRVRSFERRHMSLSVNPSPAPERDDNPLAQASFNRDELLRPGELTPEWRIREITTPKALEVFAKRLAKEKVFSVDTETWGPEGEPLDRDLCLIQIGIPRKNGGTPTEGKGQVVLIDVLALQAAADLQTQAAGEKVNPLAALKSALENANTTKVVHHAQFETEQFAKYGIKLQGVTDTEKYAKELRPDLYSYSLKACCLEILGVSMSKEEQKSDWHKRPLAPEQVAYAALDAEWTMRLFQKLQKMEKSLAINPKMDVDELLSEVVGAAGRRMELLRRAGIGNELALEEVRMDRLKEAIKDKLMETLGPGEKAIDHSGPYGSAKAGRRAVTELNVNKLKQELPDVAAEVIYETAKIKEITDALKERGFDAAQIEDVMSRLKDIVGYSKPSAELWPKFSRIYSGEVEKE